MGEAALVTEDNQTPIIRVDGFHKRYRKRAAVNGVDLEVQPGEIYGLIGPDGAGKSSLMKAVAGVLAHDAGQVEVFGISVDSEAAAERIKGRLGFMPQGLGLNLYPELSVEENIDFFARLRLVPEADLVERKRQLLAMTRLDRFRDRPMKHLSGGMKQKLGLVCTLIHEPQLLVLDEPTTGVDAVSRRDFWSILTELLRERGITALISTAYMDEAMRFQRLSLMYGGRVLAAGEPDEILKQVPGCVVEVQAKPQIKALERLKERFPHVEALGPRLRVFIEDLEPATAQGQVAETLAGLTVRDLHAAEPELEDAFVALLRRRRLVQAETAAAINSSDPTDPPQRDAFAIEARGLTRDFDSFRAVNDVSFRVPQGEIFGLLGANGAGKTTVIKMLAGILAPTSGEGQVAGADMRGMGRVIKERIGYVSQVFSLYQDLSVMENIRLYAGIYGLNRRTSTERSKWILEMTGLAGYEAHLAGRLPIGIRQRLALGCALVHQPQVLFLDEPTSGVDPIGRRRIWEILLRLSRVEGVTVLVTTHYMSEAEHCDHLVLMHAGSIIADASPQAMKQSIQEEAGQLLEIRVQQPLLVLELLEQEGFEGLALFGRRIHVFAKDLEKEKQKIQSLLTEHGLLLLGIVERRPTMEDVFIHRILALEKQKAAR